MTDRPIIEVPCEGSGLPAYDAESGGYGNCQMCGAIRWLHDDGAVTDHYRHDIVAMIARGDFDG